VHSKIFNNSDIDNSVQVHNDRSDESLSLPEVQSNSTDSKSVKSVVSYHESPIKSSSNLSFQQSDDILEDVSNRTSREKLRHWALDNINILTLNVVTQLLIVLRKGHEDLPKTAQQLLGTKHCQPMKTSIGTSSRNVQSVLCELENFDQVNDVALDSMHLLYLGAMKNLLEKLFVVKKHPARLKSDKIKILKTIMESVSSDIP
ncbi:hypothetical protein PV327_011264, partial [Microctonus hyperodae]